MGGFIRPDRQGERLATGGASASLVCFWFVLVIRAAGVVAAHIPARRASVRDGPHCIAHAFGATIAASAPTINMIA